MGIHICRRMTFYEVCFLFASLAIVICSIPAESSNIRGIGIKSNESNANHRHRVKIASFKYDYVKTELIIAFFILVVGLFKLRRFGGFDKEFNPLIFSSLSSIQVSAVAGARVVPSDCSRHSSWALLLVSEQGDAPPPRKLLFICSLPLSPIVYDKVINCIPLINFSQLKLFFSSWVGSSSDVSFLEFDSKVFFFFLLPPLV